MSMAVKIDPTDRFAEIKYEDYSDMVNGPKAMATTFFYNCLKTTGHCSGDLDYYLQRCRRSGRTEQQCEDFAWKAVDALCKQLGGRIESLIGIPHPHLCYTAETHLRTTAGPYVPPMSLIPATTGKPAAASFPILPTVGGFVVGAILTITAVMIIQLVCKKIKKSKNAKTSAVPQKGK